MNSSSGSSTVTITTGDNSLSNSQHLSSSRAAPSSNRKSPSATSKAYKHASQLFLTRRFPEALSVLEPVLTPAKHVNGYKEDDEVAISEAPVANATTTQRIKAWVLYITLLNAIVDLGEHEGKRGFGQTRYREIVNRVRKGDIWETVVRDGYGGREGSVDAEVVYNLATLLLGQASSQAATQSRLETYLASSSRIGHDLTPCLNHDASLGSGPFSKGTETPKDLTSRLNILELFTLHVLPRNDEWDYARSFISMSDMLDDERRDAFLQSLQELKEVRVYEMQEEESILQQQKDAQLLEQLEDKNKTDAEMTASHMHASGRNGSIHRRTSSEVDYGIEQKQPNSSSTSGPKLSKAPSTSGSAPTPSAARTQFPPPVEGSRDRKVRRSPQKQSPALFQQVGNLFRVLQKLAYNMVTSAGADSKLLLKMLLSLLAIIMALSRRDIRARAKRILNDGWGKIRNTVGMGVKVSYI